MNNSPQNLPMSSRMKLFIGLGIGCGCLTLLIPIGGILLAIALPSFLNQANKAKQSEAKQYVGSILRAEQAYFLETGQLTDSVEKLGLPSNLNNSINYNYSVKVTPGNPQSVGIVEARPKGKDQARLKPIVGIVRGNKKSSQSETIICTASRPGPVPYVTPPLPTTVLACPASMIPLR
ncbi:MAG: pesticin [Alkalinema sp. RU_4_3]|nr:pesticin [Alkalinema sp. RU_4_3]